MTQIIANKLHHLTKQREGRVMSRQIFSAWILVSLVFFLFGFNYTYSQENEGVYWFEKGVNENNQEKKIEYYQKAIEKKPNFIEAYYNLGLSYLMLKRTDQAEDALKKAMYANPSVLSGSLKSNILNRLGAMYRKAGRYKEAEESLQAALNISTDKKFRALTLYEFGQTKIAQGQFDEAIRIFKQGSDISPTDRASFETGIQFAENQKKIQDLYQQATSMVQANKTSDAATLFNKVLELDPNHQDAKSQLKKMTLAVEQKQSNENEKIQSLYDQALAQIDKGAWADAILLLEKINQAQPNYKEVSKLILQAQEKQYQQLITLQLYDKGIENYDKGNYVLALVNFERVAEIDQNYKDNSSRIELTKKKIEQNNQRTDNSFALNESKQTKREESTPLDITTANNASSPDRKTDTQSYSEGDMNRSNSIDTRLLQNYYQEALDLMQKQEWLRAGIVLEKIRIMNPNYKNTDFLLGQVKQNLDVTNFSEANAGGPDSKSKTSGILLLAFFAGLVVVPVGLLFLSPATRAKYYILLKRYDKAREIYERMLTQKPNNIKLYITLANIYVNERRIDEVAIRVFERAIQYNDNLKIQLEPIVTRYYLERAKTSDSPMHLLNDSLREKLRNMGKAN